MTWATAGPCSRDIPQRQLPQRWGLCALSLGLMATPSGILGSGFTGRGGHLRTEASSFFAWGPFPAHHTTLPISPGPQTAGEHLFVPGSPPRPALTHPPCPKLVTHLCFLSLTRGRQEQHTSINGSVGPEAPGPPGIYRGASRSGSRPWMPRQASGQSQDGGVARDKHGGACGPLASVFHAAGWGISRSL